VLAAGRHPDPQIATIQSEERFDVSSARERNNRHCRVAIVDDHEVVRKGLAYLINQEPDLEICGEAVDAPSALKLILTQRPTVAVVDISLEHGDGVELVKEIGRRTPGVAVLVLSMHEEWLYADRVARAGARGFVGKQEASGHIVQAIRSLAAGGTFFGGRTNGRGPVGVASPLSKLSDRELEVLQALGKGLRAKEIAAQLGVSPKTIESHLARVKDKLDIHDATRLLRYASLWRERPGSRSRSKSRH
jgi:DNA-binding NarL/FixJ family response regulator